MPFDWLTTETTHLLLAGLSLTLWLTVITTVASLVIGIFFGLLKLSESRSLRWIASAFIEIHRNIPALVLIIFWVFAFPNLFPSTLRGQLFFDNPLVDGLESLTGLLIPYYTIAAAFALTLNTSAYLAELFRAGVGSIPQNHIDSARTLGASNWMIIRRILIPQGLRAAFPAISTRLIHNMKNTALAALVSTPEFFHSTQIAISRSFRAVEYLILAAIVYLLLSQVFASILRWTETRLNASTLPG